MLGMSFDYYVPVSFEEAAGILGQYREKAKILAGGTDLIIALQKRELSPEILVDIRKIKELKEIKRDGRYLSVGAAVSFTGLSGHPLVRELAPLLAQAASAVGSPQIRNRGTLGGNLGTASPAGDLLAPLTALEAEVLVAGTKGTRRIAVDKLLDRRGPERLQPGEIICQALIPLPGPGEARNAFVKLGRREALAISRMSLALHLEIWEKSIGKARLALGAVGPTPFRVKEAEETLVKEGLGVEAEKLMEQVSAAVAASLGARPSAPYKNIAVKGVVWEAMARCGLVCG